MALYHADSVTVPQEVLQHINRLSNCNVVLQQYVSQKVSQAFRLRCDSCHEFMSFDNLFFLSQDIVDDMAEGIRDFCQAHRHEAAREVRAPSAAILTLDSRRKFRTG